MSDQEVIEKEQNQLMQNILKANLSKAQIQQFAAKLKEIIQSFEKQQ